ncbi:MAG: hypothetical protein E7623_06090 [Ruminococcaceae bacterium]|nr:hypothetical protein [Oscillospiraceae bacterium]
MKKKIFYSELSYVIGLLILALGTALMEHADFGVSMVVAPAYILHLKLSEFFSFFSFGMAEYTLQALIILLTMIVVHKVKMAHFFSFITAVLYGTALDGAMILTELVPSNIIAIRIIFFTVGMLLCSCGVSLLFHTYISPEAYELFVKEVSSKFNININKFKTAYDCTSCIISIIMSFAFFGLWRFEGIWFGTVICALLNGTLIGSFTKIFEKIWDFKDKFSFRKYF